MNQKYAEALVNFKATKSKLNTFNSLGVKKATKFVELKKSKVVLKKLSTLKKTNRSSAIKQNKVEFQKFQKDKRK